MTDILPPLPLLMVFLAASFLLAVTPGPSVFYIVTRSIAQGRSSGLASVAGVALGNLGNAAGASIGLATLFALSSLAFSIVKYAGAAYLVYLGIQMLRELPAQLPTGVPESARLRRIFRDGFIVALFNPKTTLFFAAFLPQFMGTTAVPLQSVALGIVFVVMAAMTDTLYALMASLFAPALTHAQGFQRMGRYFSGSAFIGLGIFTAFAGNGAGAKPQ